MNFSLDVAKIYWQHCLEQWIQTHLVLASGKLVQHKKRKEKKLQLITDSEQHLQRKNVEVFRVQGQEPPPPLGYRVQAGSEVTWSSENFS